VGRKLAGAGGEASCEDQNISPINNSVRVNSSTIVDWRDHDRYAPRRTTSLDTLGAALPYG